ncbi:hypothetical protein CSC67_02605 [Pusillimonas caeni]|uniref:cupin domain-containing protein n=1 Tax=Pusillimonas caeni TaxID=1348472 RepID=UPI000E59F4C4|nr:cupin domain-containing protein [Pusillimonas caeni]TFL15633.1 hypothetical protein CSC67_02605 [Pusillimonas caeni]
MSTTTTGLRHIDSSDARYEPVNVHGSIMQKAVIFEGNYDVRSGFYRLEKGHVIRRHIHTKWVQVMVVKGCMKVEQDGSGVIEAKSGSVYFLDPHHPHTETALEETVVLVTQGEDRPGW